MLSPSGFLGVIARVEAFFVFDEVERYLPTIGHVAEEEFATEVAYTLCEGGLLAFESDSNLEDRIHRVLALLGGVRHNLPLAPNLMSAVVLASKVALIRWGVALERANVLVSGLEAAPQSRLAFRSERQLMFGVSDRAKVVPVIHVGSVNQVLNQAAIALEAGADGLFLVDHGASLRVVEEALEQLSSNSGYLPDPELGAPWVGLNLLGGIPRGAELLQNINAVWTDELPRYRRSVSHFAGVMFKHQSQRIEDVVLACARCFIPTTSGPATGRAPTVDHVRRVREHMPPNVPLAVASGLTPDNVEMFKDLVDYYMVATGVSKDFYTFDPVAMRAFVDAVRTANG